MHTGISIYPNPIINGRVIIESETQIQKIKVLDATGRILHSATPLTKQTSVECNWPSGIYILQVQTQGKWINRKIQIINN
jgi:hypothetical protein